MVAHGENEIVFRVHHLEQHAHGVLWVKDDGSRSIASPEPKKQQDTWKEPVLFSYRYPMIGSILKQGGHFCAFLESSTNNPAGLGLMNYYWYLEIEPNGLLKKNLWSRDNLSRLSGKHETGTNLRRQKVFGAVPNLQNG
jgi:hypothetical protein